MRNPSHLERASALIAALTLLAAACGSDDTDAGTSEGTDAGPSDEPSSVTLLTHDSFLVSEDVLADFEADRGVAVEILRQGDAGTMVSQAILTKDNPIADVLFGVDTTFLSRALEAGIFTDYQSPALEAVPAALRVDPAVTPVDFGDVCLNYDKAAFAELGLDPPATLEDLTDPAYRGMLVVEDPSTSSPGLAFLLATVARFGDPGWETFWEQLRANDVRVAADWEAAYYGSFSGAGEGDRPLVVSYASSPPAEVIFAETPPPEAPTGVVTDGCFRQVEYAGVLAGTDARDEAEALIDFMLSVEFQEDIPLNMFVFPVNPDADLPPEFVEHTTIPPDPASLPPAEIDVNRQRWTERWTEIVLR